MQRLQVHQHGATGLCGLYHYTCRYISMDAAVDDSAQPQPAVELFGGVLPDKRSTQSSKKIVDFNAKV